MKNLNYILKALLFLTLVGVAPVDVKSQVFAYYNSSIFNTPQNQPFVETYLTIHGPSLFAKDDNGNMRNSVNVVLKIFKDTLLVKANKYNLNGPAFKRGETAPAFIDNQRYTLPNGRYGLEITVTDNYSIRKKNLVIKDSIFINFKANEFQFSAIEALESFAKSTKPGPLTKSGFDLVPYISNYYPESRNQLNFYVEAYNASKVMEANSNFVFVYYIETADTKLKLNTFGSFKKQTAADVNPLLGRIDISKLGTGFYNLIIEAKDANNEVRASATYNFQRVNQMMDITSLQTLSKLQLEGEYFGSIKNADTLKMFVESLWPIADGLDKERIINQAIKKDPDMMKSYIIDFWQRRAADTANPLKMWASYYQQVQKVMVMFKCGKQKGYYTDRGRVFLQYGAPSVRTVEQNENNTFPYEVWQYYRTTDQTNGQFFSNRKFVFVNKMLGDDCFQLIHSDMRGEINNPRWQFELTRRNNSGISNPDNTTPGGTENNQFNQIYSNPR